MITKAPDARFEYSSDSANNSNRSVVLSLPTRLSGYPYILPYILPFRNAYNPECLALYGGPVDPAIAVGGFLSPGQDLHNSPYERATAIILTILVNNYHNKTKLLPAMEWEER